MKPDISDFVALRDTKTCARHGDHSMCDPTPPCSGCCTHCSCGCHGRPSRSSFVAPVDMHITLSHGKLKAGGEDEESEQTSSGSRASSVCNGCVGQLDMWLQDAHTILADYSSVINNLVLVLVGLAYASYIMWAIILDYQRALPLIVLTSLAVAGIFYFWVKQHYGKTIYTHCCLPVIGCLGKRWKILQWFVVGAVVIATVLFVLLQVRPRPRQFVSLAGMFVFLLGLFIFSKHPSKVQWRPVVWGLGLQFVFAVLILCTSWGFTSFHFLGQQIHIFLEYSDAGAKFVFGENFKEHMFAFKILPVIVFFSCVISMLYHVGIMQAVISRIAWIMQLTMRTSATESLTAAGNIFVGQTEAPLLVRPFIQQMTKSELHAMMTGGFATIAGGVLAAYISFGVPAEHLLCASVMNAPVALAVSKLFYPECFPSTAPDKVITVEKKQERNLLAAAAAGASSSISLVANIAANLIAFLALLEFLNAVLSWLGSMVGHEHFNFQILMGHIFTPVAFLMGVEWQDCDDVGQLLGTKTFLNEFVAYEKLSELINNRKTCVLPQISVRSEIITTYALCGFANLSSISIQLGGVGPMAPSRRGDLAELAPRALIAGTIACFITACVAGLLVVEEPFLGCTNVTDVLNMTTLNLTSAALDFSIPPGSITSNITHLSGITNISLLTVY